MLTPDGVIVEVFDGVAQIEFLDAVSAGKGVAALIAAGGRSAVKTDTSGARRTYFVSERVARDAGILQAFDEPLVDAPRKVRRARKPSV